MVWNDSKPKGAHLHKVLKLKKSKLDKHFYKLDI